MLFLVSCVALGMLLTFTVLHSLLSSLRDKQNENEEGSQMDAEESINVDVEDRDNSSFGSYDEIKQPWIWTVVLPPPRSRFRSSSGSPKEEAEEVSLYDNEVAETAC